MPTRSPFPGMDPYLEARWGDVHTRLTLYGADQVDLIRNGGYVLAAPVRNVPGGFRSLYRICVVRGWKQRAAEVYRLSLRELLPSISIPLRKSDRDVTLNLQSLIELAYENGAYDDIDYSDDPYPQLPPADAAWADALLRDKGLRK